LMPPIHIGYNNVFIKNEHHICWIIVVILIIINMSYWIVIRFYRSIYK
jgi:hypothetical protein